MDEMRAMLDDLMGKHRDVPLKEREKYVYVNICVYNIFIENVRDLCISAMSRSCRKRKRFYDNTICKYYLCGFCPYEEFRKTKNDLGICPREHDAECREEWNKLSDRERERYGYERDLKRWLDRLKSDLEKRKEANLARISGTQRRSYSQEEQNSLDAMAKQIEELLIEAQIQGERGDVDAAESLVDQADGVKEQINAIKSGIDNKSGMNITKGLSQTICPVSGLILNDEEARLRDHHSGRNYNAWKKVHEKHADLEELLKRRAASRKSERSRSPMYREREKRRTEHTREGHEKQNALQHEREDIVGVNLHKNVEGDSSEEEGQVI